MMNRALVIRIAVLAILMFPAPSTVMVIAAALTTSWAAFELAGVAALEGRR